MILMQVSLWLSTDMSSGLRLAPFIIALPESVS